ncbi:MAG TPA: hypothetical protein GXX37_01925 [Clostridiaceae bacterium]|nr:hypothetical protein [Clostridiaceae bacterium]
MSIDRSFEKLRKIVVIKNIPSNYIEEAIFILRDNENKEENLIKNDSRMIEKTMKDSDYLIKEAQNIINNYIRECEENELRLNTLGSSKKNLMKKSRIDGKVGKFRKKFSFNYIFYITLISSIIAFIYFLVQVTTY